MLQIESVLVATAIVLTSPRMTAVRSTTPRQDGYGNEVLDEAVFECTQRKPREALIN
jgi:hypothetical protein